MELNGLEYWKQTGSNNLLVTTEKSADIVVVQPFTLFHDNKRANDGHNNIHGAQGAEFAKEGFEKHRLNITQEQFDKLYHACKFHTTEHRSGDATIGTCYDAYHRDLGRVGIKLDPDNMATVMGARIAQKSLEAGVESKDFRKWLEGN